MLVAEDLHFADWLKDKPLIYPILFKGIAFSILFLVFDVVEEVLVDVFKGKTLGASIPSIGGGTPTGVFFVGIILACGSRIENRLASSKAAATLSVSRPRRSDASASSLTNPLIALARSSGRAQATVIGPPTATASSSSRLLIMPPCRDTSESPPLDGA
jgi:hypothetical protein